MYEPNQPGVRWEWIGEGWQMFSQQWQSWVLIALVAAVIYLVPLLPFYLVIIGAEAAASNHGGSMAGALTGTSLILRLVANLIIWILSGFVFAGAYHAAFKQMRGEQISVGDLFGGTPYLGPMLGAAILIGLLQSIGMVLCIIPGLVVMGLFIFTYPLIVERNLGMLDAMSASLDVTKRSGLNIVMFTLFAIVVQFVFPVVGAMACCVGLLVTFPLIFTTIACAYRDCYGLPGARTQHSEPPPPPTYGYPPPGYGTDQPTGTKLCPNCQSVVSSAASFCPRCGNRFDLA